MRELPLEAPDFATIRELGGYYADKTEFLYRLVQLADPYFLSRPRRFGKTLLVSSLKYLLQGRRDLFKGLWIDNSDYDWPVYPVITLEMNGVVGDDVADTLENLTSMLEDVAWLNKVKVRGTKPKSMFKRLILSLYEKYGQKVAILIDEYDAP
ncbi:MAG: AAA family ATPase, partial [Deltaproteobacteria bacterium]|nr:AAA family ATPase [Deltaproteobacteria bacterium]